MTQDPTAAPGRRNRPLALALGAVLAAGSAFVMPAADAMLPGGAILWQLAALALAMSSAWWAYRGVRSSTGLSLRAGRLVRLVAAGAVLLALGWVGGVAALWLLWPR